MIFGISFVRGKPIRGAKELNEYLKKLDGNYTLDINEENTLTTTKECREAYFHKVDTVVRHTGENRYDIHEAFKIEKKIESTKNMSVVDWRNLIKQFQIYVFDKMDIVV